MRNDKSMKGIMQEENVDQVAGERLNKGRARRVRLSLLGVAALASLALVATVANHLVPKVPGRPQSVAARLNWYVHNGQLQADTRTIGAALGYLMGSDRETPTVSNPPSLPVAANPGPSSPKT